MSLEWVFRAAITSSAAGAVTARPIRVPGWPIDIQVITAPAALVNLTGGMSSDPAEYAAMNSGGVAITNVGAGFYAVDEHPAWLQWSVSLDAGGPRLFLVAFKVRVEE